MMNSVLTYQKALKEFVDEYSKVTNHNLYYIVGEDFEDMQLFKCSKCKHDFWFCYDEQFECLFTCKEKVCENIIVMDIIE